MNSISKERQKVVTELNHAAESLRAKVVPEKEPEFNGFKINQWHQPYEGIPGGDFIDYFLLDKEHLAIILGDVMGKKWGAWYFAFAYAAYVRSAIRGVLQSSEAYSPSTIITEVNRSVYNDAKVSEVFSTISVVILDNKNLTAKYTGAGDLPLLHKSLSENSVNSISSNGTLLGFSNNGEYEDKIIKLNKGDSVILTTDGLIETRNKANEQFGTKRLLNLVNSSFEQRDELDFIKKKFNVFANDKFEDDISLIAIQVE